MTSEVQAAHYGRVAVVLHWLIGIALLGQIAFGLLLEDIAPRATPARAAVINLHKSCGMVLGVLIVARLAWRLMHRVPAWPASLPDWQRRAALGVHRALYACMVVMPVSGYVGSNFSKHGVRFFGTSLPAWGPDLPAAYALFNGLHVATAWTFSTLILVHVAAALQHGLVERDGVMTRIWPKALT